MKHLLFIIAMIVSVDGIASTPHQPLRSGQYTFQHRFAAQPNFPSIPLMVKISGNHITLINQSDSAFMPKGVIDRGTLMWHSKSKQWIVGHTGLDRRAEEVGDCANGPAIVDLQKRIYWTC